MRKRKKSDLGLGRNIYYRQDRRCLDNLKNFRVIEFSGKEQDKISEN